MEICKIGDLHGQRKIITGKEVREFLFKQIS